MKLTVDQIIRIYPYNILGWSDKRVTKLIETYLPYLNEFMPEFFISTKLRVCHFLAQVLHESGGFRYQEELASGEAYDTGRLAINLGNTPEADGDGQLYKGRGLIQLTGRTNYKNFNDWLLRERAEERNVYDNPNLVEEPDLSVLAAVYYWTAHSLNGLADRDDIRTITKRINGGYNGLSDREQLLDNAKKVIL